MVEHKDKRQRREDNVAQSIKIAISLRDLLVTDLEHAINIVLGEEDV